jgi:hypothetical protein
MRAAATFLSSKVGPARLAVLAGNPFLVCLSLLCSSGLSLSELILRAQYAHLTDFLVPALS